MKATLTHIFLGLSLIASCQPKIEDQRDSEPKAIPVAADSEAAIAPSNVSGAYLSCAEQEGSSELTMKCSLRETQSGRQIAFPEAYDSFYWDIQRQDPRLRLTQRVGVNSGELTVTFQGVPLDEARQLAQNSQIKLQLFGNLGSYFVSDIIGSEYGVPASKDFIIFQLGGAVFNHYVEGSTPLKLPTAFAPYSGIQGCYLACYSNNNSGAIYEIDQGIFVKGQYRVEGYYDSNICRPVGDETQEISEIQLYSNYCRDHVPACADGECWAGGDTGGWFGLLPPPVTVSSR
ncbi:hypothetical protein [Pseudobacteriovorax antillogorgiicola]|uniref:Lipoprotein n=1 Tax=Pseudobacteriovorax antillogorgiicola TaxID=1513793 RepID=A0A1Y6C2Z2_9BACT|nr:hypothetical protein [Pseudobacteriovorax antillogorgiicola]TCS50706.1 hypothetical protein EDD56_11289 [Pseudobacteriovorax antillogorgiicola]SMF40565.1 hypothetical protein SAMN06296036_11288 [Pseudobacteriovorax antillogorgiicola]